MVLFVVGVEEEDDRSIGGAVLNEVEESPACSMDR